MASINDLAEFKARAYERILLDEFESASYVSLPKRKVPTAVYTNKGLREIASYCNLHFSELHDNYLSLIERCRTEKHMEKASITEVDAKILSDYNEICKKYDRQKSGSATPLTNLVHEMRTMFKMIDHTIAYTRNAINVSKTSEKFNPVTIESLVNEGSSDSFWCNNEINLKIDEEFKGKDMFTVENMQIIIRKLMSFKSYVLNSFNKYFGDDSEFGPFGLYALVTSK